MAPAATPTTLAVIFPILSLGAVSARFVARQKRRHPYKPDDWVVVAALILCVANGVALLVGAIHGRIGKKQPLNAHGLPVINSQYKIFKKTVYSMEILTTAAIATARLAILLFYHRIFSGRLFKAWVWLLYALNGIWGIAYIFVFMFPCKPIHAWWDYARGDPSRKCFPIEIQEVYAGSSIAIDVLMLVIPWPQILKSMMSKREKAGVLAIFGLGALVIGVACAKANEFFKVAAIMKSGRHTSVDEAVALYYALTESCVAVVCACLPTLRPLFESRSLESVLGTVRSMLRSRSSRSSKSSSHRSDDEKRLDTPKSEKSGKSGKSMPRVLHGTAGSMSDMPDLGPFMTDAASSKDHTRTSKTEIRSDEHIV
ncbi:hypothetical protein BDV96DRAFT_639750 [Lophiotrema nucula]|uniref:Rhodopsin domain-containing protein n=1 Tax=Lophiotrema nucula TaxID=690887 RepID=A0A6A5ZU85_9PLEO|nr:hypothetical protein BDV96DRAFT_639750 [Lophiotrema nucula]